MSAAIIPIAQQSEVDAAWDAYQRLCKAEAADPSLQSDRAHVEARVAAHVRFCELYAAQCRRDNVVAIDGGAGVMRGFASIGLHSPKTKANVGAVLRAAMCYGAASVAISGERVDGSWIKSATNTIKGHRHIPVMRGDLRALVPYGAVPIAVDLVDDAESLPDFDHPHSAFYVFGPEDGTLGKAILDWCPRRVMVPTRHCMNLAATVNVVLYDRLTKQLARASMRVAA